MISIWRLKNRMFRSFRRHFLKTVSINVAVFLLLVLYSSWYLSNELEEFEMEDEHNNFRVKTISDFDMKIMVEEYKRKLEECSNPDDESWDDFYAFLNSPEKCDNKITVGGDDSVNSKYGRHKIVCSDKQLNLQQEECVVLSFALSNRSWNFDYEMQSKGCRVFTFDPTAIRKELIHGTNIRVYPVGLADSNKKWIFHGINLKFLSYGSILEISKLKGAIIDYVMIDIDVDVMEFYALRNIIDTQPEQLRYIKQIAVRINPGFISARRTAYYYLFLKFDCLGFKIINSEKSPIESNIFPYKDRTESTMYEIVWINKDFHT